MEALKSDLIIGMAGSGGDGIVFAGEALMTAAALEGYYAVLTKSFGSQIRGGESSCRLRVSSHPVPTPAGTLDVAVVLDWEDFARFGAELPVDGRTIIIYDAATGATPDDVAVPGLKPAAACPVPIAALAKEAAGSDKAKNAVVLGLLAGWFGLPQPGILATIRRKLAKKGVAAVTGAERAFAAGLAHAAARPLDAARPLGPAVPGARRKLLLDGNEMCAAAAIFAGCEFFSGYPITPSSEIMQLLGAEIWKYGGSVLQAEDEIAGIGAAVGASFAGKKAMTATSGPGLALKTEMLGLATMAELPLVCVDVQRGGPSTGIPTKSEQSDLFQAVFSAHGDVLRPVLAPTCVEDTFAVTVEAFNLAERYQTPVIVLSDQEIAQRKETVDQFDPRELEVVERRRPDGADLVDYARFRLTESGVSPISQPGLPGGAYLASGIEHDQRGAPTASGAMHARMNDKRFRKLQPLKHRRDLFRIEGAGDAPLCLVAWGSLAGVAREALQRAAAEGIRVKLIVPILVYPVAEDVYRDFLASVTNGLVVEQSHQGQLHRLLRMYVDAPSGVESFCRSGANPITPDEVVERLRRMAMALQRQGEAELQPALD
jgi:2-oxoglutarate/2-oxoacid ferredoxin oxidoreductase subunit alpha